MAQEHYIDGKLVPPPQNNDSVSISINFEPNDTEVQVSSTDFDWINENYDTLLSRFQSGTTGGLGILEGVKHEIFNKENGSTLKVFSGFIDLSTADWDKDKVSAKSSELGSLDWLTEVGDGFNFEDLYEEKILTDADKVFVPYIINSIPNYKDIMIANLTLVFILVEVQRTIKDATEATAKAPTVIDSASGIIELIGTIIYFVLLLVTVVRLLLDLVDLIIQRVKYVASMSVNRLLEAGCQKLGFQYKSTLLQSAPYNTLHIIPECQAPPITQTSNKIKGYLTGNVVEQTGYFKGTFSDLIRGLQEMFNLRVFISNNTLNLVPYQKPLVSATFTLPPYDITKWRTNASEFVANHILSFQTDQVDGNTIDQWAGTNVQSTLTPVNLVDRRKSLMKGVRKIQIPFARAYAKTELTVVEEVVDVFFNVLGLLLGGLVSIINAAIEAVNQITKLINKVIDKLDSLGIKINFQIQSIDPVEYTPLEDLIDNRIGMLILEKDMIGVPKVALLDVGATERDTKISTNNGTYLNASYLWQNFYKDLSFAPTANTAQRYVYEWPNVEMNLTEVQNVLNEGLVKKPDGKVVEVVSCEWNSSTKLANFVIKERKIFTNNLKETIYEPSGN
jgi:hypothetical protein